MTEELAVDGNVRILVETGVGFESGFGSGVTFDNIVIMAEETDAPFKGFRG